MKPWFYPTLAVLGVILLLVCTFFAITGYVMGPNIRIGTIDVQRVMTESKTGKDFKEEILAKRNEIGAKIQAAQEKKDQQKAIQLNMEFEQFVKDKNDEFAKVMNKKIGEIAKKKKLKAVFPSNLVNYASKVVDITEDTIEGLE